MDTLSTKTRIGWRLVAFLLVLGVAASAHAAPPRDSITLPGRKPGSTEPWGAFLGRAAHFVIGRQYKIEHPSNRVFLDTFSLADIMAKAGLGDPSQLSEFVRLLRPDITDTRALVIFEIKPDNEEGLKDGRTQVGRYLAALNEAVDPDKRLAAGIGFEGSLFLEFENGGVLWQLSWRTSEPGVTLYRWSRRPKKSNTPWEERAAQEKEVLSQEEADQHGELAERAIQAAYKEGEWPSDFQGQVLLPVDCRRVGARP